MKISYKLIQILLYVIVLWNLLSQASNNIQAYLHGWPFVPSLFWFHFECCIFANQLILVIPVLLINNTQRNLLA